MKVAHIKFISWCRCNAIKISKTWDGRKLRRDFIQKKVDMYMRNPHWAKL